MNEEKAFQCSLSDLRKLIDNKREFYSRTAAQATIKARYARERELKILENLYTNVYSYLETVLIRNGRQHREIEDLIEYNSVLKIILLLHGVHNYRLYVAKGKGWLWDLLMMLKEENGVLVPEQLKQPFNIPYYE
jgi:hypothetical protein